MATALGVGVGLGVAVSMIDLARRTLKENPRVGRRGFLLFGATALGLTAGGGASYYFGGPQVCSMAARNLGDVSEPGTLAKLHQACNRLEQKRGVGKFTLRFRNVVTILKVHAVLRVLHAAGITDPELTVKMGVDHIPGLEDFLNMPEGALHAELSALLGELLEESPVDRVLIREYEGLEALFTVPFVQWRRDASGDGGWHADQTYVPGIQLSPAVESLRLCGFNGKCTSLSELHRQAIERVKNGCRSLSAPVK